MGCTSSSLKRSDPHRDDLTTQEIAPRVVAAKTSTYAAPASYATLETSDYDSPASHTSSDAVMTESMQRRQSSTKMMLEAYPHKKSAFAKPTPSRSPMRI